LSEHLNVRALAIKNPKYLSSATYRSEQPSWVKILVQSTLQRGPIRKQHDFFALMTMSRKISSFSQALLLFTVPVISSQTLGLSLTSRFYENLFNQF